MNKEDYTMLLQGTEKYIEETLYSIVYCGQKGVYKSPKAEERLTALCLGRQYILDKIGDNKNEQ